MCVRAREAAGSSQLGAPCCRCAAHAPTRHGPQNPPQEQAKRHRTCRLHKIAARATRLQDCRRGPARHQCTPLWGGLAAAQREGRVWPGGARACAPRPSRARAGRAGVLRAHHTPAAAAPAPPIATGSDRLEAQEGGGVLLPKGQTQNGAARRARRRPHTGGTPLHGASVGAYRPPRRKATPWRDLRSRMI